MAPDHTGRSMASRLYRDAAEILSRMEKKQGSLKSLVFSQTFSVSKKKVYALVCQTLKCKAAQMRDAAWPFRYYTFWT